MPSDRNLVRLEESIQLLKLMFTHRSITIYILDQLETQDKDSVYQNVKYKIVPFMKVFYYGLVAYWRVHHFCGLCIQMVHKIKPSCDSNRNLVFNFCTRLVQIF